MQDTLTNRPTNCQCWNPEQALECWPCRRAGFETPNPNPPENED